MRNARAELVLNLVSDYQFLSSSFVEASLAKMGVKPEVREDLSQSLSILVNLIAAKSRLSRHDPKLKLCLGPQEQRLLLELLNYGEPLAPGELSKFSQTASHLNMQFENLGRQGQRIEFDLGPVIESESEKERKRLLLKDQAEIQLESRLLKPGEEQQVSEIFYRVYGYNYINDLVYHPERLRDLIKEGAITSVVTVDKNGKVLGHVALMRLNSNPPVYEAALGVSDPDIQGAGVFKKTFDYLARVIKDTPMQYCVYDFVTNHDRSQRLVAKYGYSEMCIHLGSQTGETQARLERLGMGHDDPEMQRYSLLVGIGSFKDQPFGKGVWLPTNLGESCGFLLSAFKMDWTPAPRFYPLQKEGDYDLALNKEQKSALFDFKEPGMRGLKDLIDEHKQLLRDGYQYVAVEMPLDRPGVGQVYDALSQIGFFISGFVPYKFSERLGFRFQFLLPTKVSFEGLQFYQPESRRLLGIVRKSFERNTRL